MARCTIAVIVRDVGTTIVASDFRGGRSGAPLFVGFNLLFNFIKIKGYVMPNIFAKIDYLFAFFGIGRNGFFADWNIFTITTPIYFYCLTCVDQT